MKNLFRQQTNINQNNTKLKSTYTSTEGNAHENAPITSYYARPQAHKEHFRTTPQNVSPAQQAYQCMTPLHAFHHATRQSLTPKD